MYNTHVEFKLLSLCLCETVLVGKGINSEIFS